MFNKKMINVFVKILAWLTIIAAVASLIYGFFEANENTYDAADAAAYFFGYEVVAIGFCMFVYSGLAAIYKINNSK